VHSDKAQRAANRAVSVIIHRHSGVVCLLRRRDYRHECEYVTNAGKPNTATMFIDVSLLQGFMQPQSMLVCCMSTTGIHLVCPPWACEQKTRRD